VTETSVEVPATPANPEPEEETPPEPSIGQITFVSCATGSDDVVAVTQENLDNSGKTDTPVSDCRNISEIIVNNICAAFTN
jgi:hypothetical protein